MDLSSALVAPVDAVFADMNLPQHPGAALLVIDHGEHLYSKCYGLAVRARAHLERRHIAREAT